MVQTPHGASNLGSTSTSPKPRRTTTLWLLSSSRAGKLTASRTNISAKSVCSSQNCWNVHDMQQQNNIRVSKNVQTFGQKKKKKKKVLTLPKTLQAELAFSYNFGNPIADHPSSVSICLYNINETLHSIIIFLDFVYYFEMLRCHEYLLPPTPVFFFSKNKNDHICIQLSSLAMIVLSSFNVRYIHFQAVG